MSQHNQASSEERLTVAPIVGPEDPRRFTDSGIEIEPLYNEDDLPAELDLGDAGRVPLHARRAPRDVPQTDVDDAPVRGLCLGQGVKRALPLPALQGFDRPVDGLRPAHAAGPGLRQSALPRRGRPHRCGDRHDRRHAHRFRRDPAGRGLDVDDDQRAGGVPAAALRPSRRGAGRAEREATRDDPERRAQGVHRARQLHLSAAADDAPDDRPVPVLPGKRAEVEHDLDLRLPLPREGLLSRAGGRLHACPRGSPT